MRFASANSGSAANLTGTVAASQLTGTVLLAQLPASVVTNGASGLSLSGTFSGNGAGMTNVNIANVFQNIGVPLAWGQYYNGGSFVGMNAPSMSNVVAMAGAVITIWRWRATGRSPRGESIIRVPFICRWMCQRA
jgi:hypothetical protein